MNDREPDALDRGDLAARRERVVGAVQARIAAAPPVIRVTAMAASRVDIIAWALPALVAATIVLAASVASLARSRTPAADYARVADALGVPAPLTDYMATGKIDAWAMLYPRGGSR